MFKIKGELLCLAKVLFVVAIVFLTGSCSTAMRMYSGPERPASETALIRVADMGINIESCDRVRVTSTDVSVLPGEHTIEMSLGNPNNTAFLKFAAIAGHTYVVDTEVIPTLGSLSPFIKDKSTGERVSINVTYEERLLLVEKSIKEHPQNIDFLVKKGELLWGLKRYEEALLVLDTAISFNPNFSDAWSIESSALYGLKRYDDALIAIDKAIKLRPNTPWYVLNKKVITNAIEGRPASSPMFFTR